MSINQTSPQKKKIVWISSLILDIHLHKTSQIEVLRALAKRGHEVFLVASYSSKKDPHELADVHTISIPLRYVPIFSTVAYVLLLLLYLPLFFLYLKPDFVIVEPNPTTFSLAPIFLFPRSRKPKIILDIRTTPVYIFGIRGYLKTLFFNISLPIAKKFFQGITIITSLMKKEVCEKFNIDSKSVGVWTSGVSTIAFDPENYSGTAMRKKFGLEHKFVIFYHGDFGKTRGTIEAIKATEILKNQYPNLVLFLLGSGKLNLAIILQKMNIQNMVIVHESVRYAEVPKYIAMCDVGIVPLPNLPDWRYQCPLNLLEYLAMKKVVIATDIPANREILGKSKCGIYASSADPKAIADAIVCAYNNREMLNEWGALGRMIVEEKYSWMKVTEDFEVYLFRSKEPLAARKLLSDSLIARPKSLTVEYQS